MNSKDRKRWSKKPSVRYADPKSAEDLRSAYEKQRGTTKLTTRQERRVRQRENKEKGWPASVLDETSNFTEEDSE